MTLKQFRQATAHLPDDMEIFIGERLTVEDYGLVNSVHTKEIIVCDYEDTWEMTKYRKGIILTED